MDVLMIGLGIIAALGYLRICGRQRRPVKAMLANSMAGVILLVISAAVTGITGFGIPVTWVSVMTASVLGVPGVGMIMLLGLVI